MLAAFFLTQRREALRHKGIMKTKHRNYVKYFQPFVRVENFQPLHPSEPHLL